MAMAATCSRPLANAGLSEDLLLALAQLDVKTTAEANDFLESPFRRTQITQLMQEELCASLCKEEVPFCCSGSNSHSDSDSDSGNNVHGGHRRRRSKGRSKKAAKKQEGRQQRRDLAARKGKKGARKYAAERPPPVTLEKLMLKGDHTIGAAERRQVASPLTPFVDTVSDDEDNPDKKEESGEFEEISFSVRLNESTAFQGARFRKTGQLTVADEQQTTMYELRYRASVAIDAALSNVQENTPEYDALAGVPSGTITQPYPDLTDVPSGQTIEVWLVPLRTGTEDYAVSELDAALLSEAAVHGNARSQTDARGNVYHYYPSSARKGGVTIDTIQITLNNAANDVKQINLALQRGAASMSGAKTYEIVYLSLWMSEEQYLQFKEAYHTSKLKASFARAKAEQETQARGDNDIIINDVPGDAGEAAGEVTEAAAAGLEGVVGAIGEDSTSAPTEAASWREYRVRNSRYKHVVVPGSRTLVGGIRVSVPVHLEIGPEVELSERPEDIVTLTLQGNTLELEYRRDASQMGSGTFKLRSIRLESPEVESWTDALAWWHRYHNQRVPTDCVNPYSDVAAEYGYDDVERLRNEAMYT